MSRDTKQKLIVTYIITNILALFSQPDGLGRMLNVASLLSNKSNYHVLFLNLRNISPCTVTGLFHAKQQKSFFFFYIVKIN